MSLLTNRLQQSLRELRGGDIGLAHVIMCLAERDDFAA
jgi:hypothetical protein